MVATQEKKTCVVGIEHIDELVELSINNLNKSYAQKLIDKEI